MRPKEKLLMLGLALLLAILLFSGVSHHNEKEKAVCKSFCELYDSNIKDFQQEICICQK